MGRKGPLTLRRRNLKTQLFPYGLACAAGGMRERACGGGAAIFHRGEFASGEAANETRLFTNPPTASPLPFTASQPKQKHSRAKSRKLRRLRTVRPTVHTSSCELLGAPWVSKLHFSPGVKTQAIWAQALIVLSRVTSVLLDTVCQHEHLASATEVLYWDKMFSGSSKMSVYRLCLGATGRFLPFF